MDENASRAVFLGVSVFVAIITITLIINFYYAAKDAASVANTHDISNTGNKYINDILVKDMITGMELRYLLNYCVGDEKYEITIFGSTETVIDYSDYGEESFMKELDNLIRPNYNYKLTVSEENRVYKIRAEFKY